MSANELLKLASLYRLRGKKLREEAEQVTYPPGRESLLDMANGWDELAAAAERDAASAFRFASDETAAKKGRRSGDAY